MQYDINNRQHSEAYNAKFDLKSNMQEGNRNAMTEVLNSSRSYLQDEIPDIINQ